MNGALKVDKKLIEMNNKSFIILIVFTLILIFFFRECSDWNKRFKSTSYSADKIQYGEGRLIKNPNSDDFIVMYIEESSMSFGSSIRIIKLYTKDSISIDECYYGWHTLDIKTWTNSIITFTCGVYSATGDTEYRKWYLDNSVDKNQMIGIVLFPISI